MNEKKKPVIMYVLYTVAVLIAIYGCVQLVMNIQLLSNVLKQYTFKAMNAGQKNELINMIADPIVKYGFQVAVLCGAAYCCGRVGSRQAEKTEETDDEMEEATFGTVLTEEDLEEARNMVEAESVENSNDAE